MSCWLYLSDNHGGWYRDLWGRPEEYGPAAYPVFEKAAPPKPWFPESAIYAVNIPVSFDPWMPKDTAFMVSDGKSTVMKLVDAENEIQRQNRQRIW